MKKILTASAVFLCVFSGLLALSGCGVQIDQNGDMVFVTEERALLSEADAKAGTEPASEAAEEPDTEAATEPEEILPEHKYIGAPSSDGSVRRVSLLNLTGQNILEVSVCAEEGNSEEEKAEEKTSGKDSADHDNAAQEASKKEDSGASDQKETETKDAGVTNQKETETQDAAATDQKETEKESGSENLLPEGEVFEADEVRDFYYEADPSNYKIDIKFTLEDGTSFVIHSFPFFDLEEGRLCLQNDVMFLEYVSVWTGEEVLTRKAETEIKEAEKEKAEAEKRAAEEAARKAAEAEAARIAEEEAVRKAEEEALAAQLWQQQQWEEAQAAQQWQPDYSVQQNTGGDGCIDDDSLMY